MIKVTIGESKTQNEKPFPKLIMSGKGTIVLFHKPKYGFVVKPGSLSNNEFTDYPENWKMSCFTDYNEPITIQNV